MSKAIHIVHCTFLSDHANSYKVQQLQHQTYVSKKFCKKIAPVEEGKDVTDIRMGTEVQLHIPGWLAAKCNLK